MLSRKLHYTLEVGVRSSTSTSVPMQDFRLASDDIEEGNARGGDTGVSSSIVSIATFEEVGCPIFQAGTGGAYTPLGPSLPDR